MSPVHAVLALWVGATPMALDAEGTESRVSRAGVSEAVAARVRSVGDGAQPGRRVPLKGESDRRRAKPTRDRRDRDEGPSTPRSPRFYMPSSDQGGSLGGPRPPDESESSLV